MKANEYVKQNGWAMARKAVAECNYGYGIDLDELKLLVESHELVSLFDDIDCAKAWVSDLDSDYPYQVKGSDTKIFKWQLEYAIADVESCYD